MRGEVGKKTTKKDMDNPSFLWRHIADFEHFFGLFQAVSYELTYSVGPQLKSLYLYSNLSFREG